MGEKLIQVERIKRSEKEHSMRSFLYIDALHSYKKEEVHPSDGVEGYESTIWTKMFNSILHLGSIERHFTTGHAQRKVERLKDLLFSQGVEDDDVDSIQKGANTTCRRQDMLFGLRPFAS